MFVRALIIYLDFIQKHFISNIKSSFNTYIEFLHPFKWSTHFSCTLHKFYLIEFVHPFNWSTHLSCTLKKLYLNATVKTASSLKKGLWHKSFAINFETAENISRQLLLLPLQSLVHFQPMFHFYTPGKHQKTGGLLMFSGGIEMKHLVENGLIFLLLF